jgi:hypothetical protein
MKIKNMLLVFVAFLVLASALPAGADMVRIGGLYALNTDIPVVSTGVGHDADGGYIVIYFLDQPAPIILWFADYYTAQYWHNYIVRFLKWNVK